MKYPSSASATAMLTLIMLLLSPLNVAAEPVGELLPLSESGEALMVMSGGSVDDMAAEIPAKETVGLPVYPGSFYTTKFEGEGMLPSVTMASKDPMDVVKAWYEKQDGLTWSDDFGMFYVGEKYEMMKSESVFLQDISADPQNSAGGLGFDMTGMQTQITISYKPRAAE